MGHFRPAQRGFAMCDYHLEADNGSRAFMSTRPGPPACPNCGKAAEEKKFRPFCSRRCADVDLNRWLSDVYVVPAVADDDDRASNPLAGEEP